MWSVEAFRTCPAAIGGCPHPDATNCKLVRDMAALLTRVNVGLRGREDAPLKKFTPAMIVVGSVAEGTRTVIANEMDITMEFDVGIQLI